MLRPCRLDGLTAFSTRLTTSPMPRMRPAMRCGMEILERVELLAGADELDRLAGDGAHGERRAAAAIAVDTGQHDAGDADLLIEIAREIDRVLAGQRVGDEQRLVRLRDVAHWRPSSAISSSSICARPAVSSMTTSKPPRRASASRAWRSATGVSPATIGKRRQHPLCSPRTRAAPARRDGACRARPSARACFSRSCRRLGDLGGGRRLARALQADHQDRHRRRVRRGRWARRRSRASRRARRGRS